MQKEVSTKEWNGMVKNGFLMQKPEQDKKKLIHKDVQTATALHVVVGKKL